jgi:hypothetical protein
MIPLLLLAGLTNIDRCLHGPELVFIPEATCVGQDRDFDGDVDIVDYSLYCLAKSAE